MKHLCNIGLVVLTLTLVGATGSAWAQSPRLEKILSIANPTLAEGAEQIIFDTHDLSLGLISEDDTDVKGSFTLSNDSDSPIIITRIAVSCPCVDVNYTKRPLMSGESTKIDFSYAPKGFPGRINRRLTIYTNLSQSKPSALLTISGEVEPSKDHSGLYPHSCGVLRLRQPQVSFTSGSERAVERIVVFNDSPKALRLGVLGSLPAGLSFATDPEVIAPNSEAEIVISHDPTLWRSKAPSYGVIIDGLGVAPSMSTIEVNFNYLNKQNNEIKH